MLSKHKFSNCTQCMQTLYFEDSRKRIENGKWVHAACWKEGIHKPYPVPHQIANGKKHIGGSSYNNGNGNHAIAIAEPVTSNQDPIAALEAALVGIKNMTSSQDLISRDEIITLIDSRLEELAKPSIIEVRNPSGATVTIKSAHKQFSDLLDNIADREHTYLYGEPGSGKSTAARQCAEALNLAYAYSSLNPQTPESRLIGFMHAGGQYVETEFYRLYKNGGIYCLDEMDNASPALLTTLNSLLDNGHGSFPCGMVARHKDFVLVATGNTNGQGANIRFPDRRRFDSAFAERFLFMAWDYDLDQEKALTLAINPAALPWLEWVRQVRRYVVGNDIQLVVSPRASFKGAKKLLRETFGVSQIAEMAVFKGLDPDMKSNILRNCPMPNIQGRRS